VATSYTDHNVSPPLAELLRTRGHDVLTARDVDQEAAGDDEHLLFAAQTGRMLVTHNVADFLLLHHAWRRWPLAWNIQPLPEHAGILVLPQPPRAASVAAARAIEEFIIAGSPTTNALWQWQPHTGWQERQ
jgi:hypothetical protein